MDGTKSSDGTACESASSVEPYRCAIRPKRWRIRKHPNEIITPDRKDDMVYIGLDLHKKTIQIAAVDDSGTELMNKKIQNAREALAGEISKIPSNSKYVIESLSVWEEVYRHRRNELGLGMVLSDPYKTRPIAESKKADKVDALMLADMLRGGYIAECYVPEGRTADERKLVRY